MHQVYPYIYIEYDLDKSQFEQFRFKLETSLEVALQHSLGYTTSLKSILEIELVQGTCFYGYHAKPRLFAKIYILYPNHVQRIVSILQSGALMNSKFRVYESHIPYLLQFLVDYNLYGMGNIELSFYKSRAPHLKNYTGLVWNNMERTSYCEMELGKFVLIFRYLARRNPESVSSQGKTHWS